MQSSRRGQEIDLWLQSGVVSEVMCSEAFIFVQWLTSRSVGKNRGQTSSFAVQKSHSRRARAHVVHLDGINCPGLPLPGLWGESEAACVSLLGRGGPCLVREGYLPDDYQCLYESHSRCSSVRCGILHRWAQYHLCKGLHMMSMHSDSCSGNRGDCCSG